MNNIEFLFSIDRKSKETLTFQLYNQIKSEILSNNYKNNDKIPSVRTAVNTLQVSKSTVINAYLQLVTEGFIKNISQKGFFVCNIASFENKNTEYELNYKEKNISYINDGIDRDSFSRSLYKKYYNKVITDDTIDLTNLGDEQGEYELRNAISKFVASNRGCVCTPEQVIIGSGIQTLVSMLVRITKDDYKKVAHEYPGYKKVEYIFNDFNIPTNQIPVTDSGVDMNIISKTEDAYIYVSPSYQYPLGKVMTIDKRITLINHAKSKNCLIIEDDYASIIRYNTKPISSLQGLDSFGNTVYLGSFSKTFLPSLRISFMIIPEKYIKKYYDIKSKYTHTTSKIEQLALAKFITDGQMTKHFKKINNLYKQKNLIISNHLKNSKKLKIINSESGFHMILSCKTYRDESFLQELKDEFLKIEIISFKNNNLTFLFSYSGLEIEEIPTIIDRIIEILQCKEE